LTFEKNIFINCPFDREYKQLLKAIIFTVVYLKFEPRISTTVSSGDLRIAEIMKMIEESKYSIHDISRCEPLNNGDLPRFNMPYELGLDVGCSKFGKAKLRSKKCLILEKEKNRYDIVISDISGQDIKAHDDKPKKAIEKILEWFTANGALPILEVPSLSTVWAKFQDTNAKIVVTLSDLEYKKADINSLSTSQFIYYTKLALGYRTDLD
jgi:hypothetical protein